LARQARFLAGGVALAALAGCGLMPDVTASFQEEAVRPRGSIPDTTQPAARRVSFEPRRMAASERPRFSEPAPAGDDGWRPPAEEPRVEPAAAPRVRIRPIAAPAAAPAPFEEATEDTAGEAPSPAAAPRSEPDREEIEALARRSVSAPSGAPRRITAPRPAAEDTPAEASSAEDPPAERATAVAAAPADRPGDLGARTAAALNAYRRGAGLEALWPDPALTIAARSQAEAMAKAGSMSHKVGGGFADRLAKVGVENVAAAENIAAGYRTIEAVLDAWKASPAHDANLKLAEATRFGVASVMGGGETRKRYWALVLAGE
jgi:uncharacterized protein YkwD